MYIYNDFLFVRVFNIHDVETSSTVVVTLETERVKVILLSLISLRVLILENQKLVAKKIFATNSRHLSDTYHCSPS